jgi:O-antigen/teichoic acid export membrane protein
MAHRHLALMRVSVINIICQVGGLVVMVVWGLFDPTIRALVVGVLIVGPLRVVLTHLALPGTANRLAWDAASAREILGFGKWILLSSLLGFLVMSGDRIILGGLTDADTLGQYAIAFLIVAAMQQVSAAIIGNVALPALSETCRSHPQRLKATFYRLRTPIDIAILALVGFFVAAGPWIIDLLYDERYRLAGPLIQILAISLFAVRYDVATQCYLALGKSGLITPIVAVRLPLLFVLTPIAFHYGGLLAATWVIALVPFASIPVHLVLMHRNGILDVRREIVVLPSLAAGFVGGSVLRMI